MGKTRPVEKAVIQYFDIPEQSLHRQYLAMRNFLYDGEPADIVAKKFGYATTTIYY